MSKKDADAYDRLLEAAARLADVIASGGVAVEEEVMEELTVFLAEHSLVVSRILRNVRSAGQKDTPQAAGMKSKRSQG